MGTSAYLNASYRPLFNGNISSMAVNIAELYKFDSSHWRGPLLYNYRYDQLNRLTGMDAFYGLNQSTNSWGPVLYSTPDFKERVAFDPNGNIQKYLRNNFGGTGLPMDSLGYGYMAGTNKLLQIKDSASDAIGGGYDLHSQPTNNYAYDSIGNLIKDSIEHISLIKWNVYGKITEIDHSTTSLAKPTKNIYYYYDAAGNRIGKKTTSGDSSTVSYTWYVRDASGNVMATYTAGIDSSSALSTADLHVGEKDIYGSSRLGLLNANYTVDAAGDGFSAYTSPWTGVVLPYYTGRKQYELTNHLGNVLATISDKKIGVSLSSDSSLIDHYEADVQTAQDYYPFGMIMPGRMFTSLSIPGGSIDSGTSQVNGYTLPVDLVLTSRTSDMPSQYVATQMIDLDQGFGSGDSTDVFTAYIADTTYAGTGNGGSDPDGVAGQGKYRYGFNGKENDNEVKGIGDQIDYGMRIYDPRVGRFLSVDPLQKKYPWFTPYQFAGNSPIANVDLDGRENYCFEFAWDAKSKGLNCINVYVQKNEESFLDILFDREPANWTGTPIKGQHFTYNFNNELFSSYEEMLKYHAANPTAGTQTATNEKMSDAQKALITTASLAACEVASQSMENLGAGGSVDYTEMATEEGEVLFGEYSILKNSIKEENNVVSKTTEEQTASANNTNGASTGNTGSGPRNGIISLTSTSKSTKAFTNSLSTNSKEFLYDPENNTILLGSNSISKGGGHVELASSVGKGIDDKTVVGGMIRLNRLGKIETSEGSGHYGQNWTPEIRKRFTEAMKQFTGENVDHSNSATFKNGDYK